MSLLEEKVHLMKAGKIVEMTEEEKQAAEEKELMEAWTQDKALMSVQELATGVSYNKPMPSSWSPPSWAVNWEDDHAARIRRRMLIEVEGTNPPPPLTKFEAMRLPKPILGYLAERSIVSPTPIQIQGIPTILSGRDMIGVAFTGSGKTLVFVLPLVLFALEEEMRMPVTGGEGPIGLVLNPSRELARQTYNIAKAIAASLVTPVAQRARAASGAPPYPEIRCMLCMGGIKMGPQLSLLDKGIHAVVATPGRLLDMLGKKKFNLDNCRYICLDEADRLISMGFEEALRDLLSFFKAQRQTVLFSATMPANIQSFAQTALISPIIVNVGRAGAASMDIIQEVEFCLEPEKIVYLLSCLEKTAPPALVFAENKRDVDAIHEYLLLKGVEAVSIHGDKSQEEREEAIDFFFQGKKDVLVATDIASKGLDFPAIQHVINYDLPEEIENYVHRIGRTGRGGKTGVATTLINRSNSVVSLMDLRALLIEAKQRIPPILLGSAGLLPPIPKTASGKIKGCAFCGGPGHRITECPQLEARSSTMAASHSRNMERSAREY